MLVTQAAQAVVQDTLSTLVSSLGDEVLSRLDALALQLGVTVGQVFEILTHQASVLWIGAAFVFVIAVILTLLCLYSVKNHYKAELYSDTEAIWGISMIVTGAFSAIAFMWTFITSYQALMAFVNPEYWALRHILALLQ